MTSICVVLNEVQTMEKTVQPTWKDLAASNLGRIFFLAHLLIYMIMVGYVWNHPGNRPPYPLFNQIFEIFWRLDSGYRENLVQVRWDYFGMATRFNDAVLTLFLSLPWWVYGFSVEYCWSIRHQLSKRFDKLSLPIRADVRSYIIFKLLG
jgi:hypothetical protein